MYKTKVNTVLKTFSKVNKMVGGELLEISVKKSRLNFEFQNGDLVSASTIMGLLKDELIDEENLYMTDFNNSIRITFECKDMVEQGLIPDKSVFSDLFVLLQEIGDHICQCPALEYTISTDFIKVYIDKPNIFIDDLNNLQEVFDSNFSLELQKQRPYCLFVKKNNVPDDTLDALSTIPTLTSNMVRKI